METFGSLKILGSDVWTIIIVGITAIVLLYLLYLLLQINDFRRELRFVKMEIRRSNGTERKYWLRQKRKLWLSLLPFVKYRQK